MGSPSRLSTLITSAPRSASCSVANGAAMNTPTSSTCTPSSGGAGALGTFSSVIVAPVGSEPTRHYQNQPGRERRERNHREPPLQKSAVDELALLSRRIGDDQGAARRKWAGVDGRRGNRERRNEPDRADFLSLQEWHRERNERAEDTGGRGKGGHDSADVANREGAHHCRADPSHRAAEVVDRAESLHQAHVGDDA